MTIEATRRTTGVQLPVPGARIALYRQGATVSADASITTTATVNVFDPGSLHDSAVVQAEVGGPILTVTGIGSLTQITLRNDTGATVTIPAGTRLILLSSRPIAYQDPLGINYLGSSFTADSGGRARVYLPEGRYDSVITDPADPVIAHSSITQATITSGSSMTLSPTVASGQSILLVAISWQEPTSTETLDSVTCNGAAMTRLGAGLFTELYYLMNPSSGSKTIVATWSGSGTKAAVGEAFTVIGTNASDPFGALFAASGSGTTAGVPAAGALSGAFVLATACVNTAPGTTTVTLESGATSLWSQSTGTTGALDRIQALGASRTGSGSAASLTWSISASRAWGAVSIELLPAWSVLLTDSEAGLGSLAGFGILATHYASLQAAVDALPSIGGVVYIPAGTYLLTQTLLIEKPNVTLIGEGVTTILTSADPDSLPIDVVTVTAQRTRIYNLRIDSAATAADFTSGQCGLVILGSDADSPPPRLVQHCYLENVVVNGSARYGVWIRDTIIMTAINCEFSLNQGGGVRIQGAEEGGICAELLFIGCNISTKQGIGVDIGDASMDTGMQIITLLNCTIEQNQGASLAEDISDVGVNVNAEYCYKMEIRSCYMEGPPEDCEQMVRLHNCPNVTVDGCVITGNVADYEAGPTRGIYLTSCTFARCSGNVLEGFSTDIIKIEADCSEAVEFCNRDLNASTVPRIANLALRSISMSKPALGIPRVGVIGDLPTATDFQPGSMIWVETVSPPDKHLQVSSGSTWIGI